MRASAVSRTPRVLLARAEKRWRTEYTRGGRCGDLRETACTGGCGSCTTSNQWRFGGGGYPLCWQIADFALGERLRRSQLACAHAVLAGHNLNIIYYITSLPLPLPLPRTLSLPLALPLATGGWWLVAGGTSKSQKPKAKSQKAASNSNIADSR
jgi:hypothetical protein